MPKRRVTATGVRYRAEVRYQGKWHYLGVYDTEIAAYQVEEHWCRTNMAYEAWVVRWVKNRHRPDRTHLITRARRAPSS